MSANRQSAILPHCAPPARDIAQLLQSDLEVLIYLSACGLLHSQARSAQRSRDSLLASTRRRLEKSGVGTMTDSARWKATVYVGGLASLATTTNLHDAFIPFGEIADISLPKNDAPNATEPHRGFAYVEYEDAEDAKEAIDNMDQSEFFGRILKVSAAKPPKSAEEGLGSKTAVWEQEGWLAKHAVSEEDRLATPGDDKMTQDDIPDDPMQGLEGLDVAGPKPE